MFQKLSLERQIRIPPWPAGRGIEAICGFFACMSLLVGASKVALGYFWPSLGKLTFVETIVSLTLVIALGSVWLLLRLDKLRLARITLVLDALLLVGLFIFLGVRILSGQASQMNGSWPAILLLFSFFVLFLLWLAQREVGHELNRRRDHENA